ncbi:MAG: hypothetical protein J6Q61_04275 [Bacteroidales bacterium]|nr:hypothetical protein [Bacteroidales bacterium]
MDYIRIKSQSRKVAKSQSGDSSEPIANGQQLTVQEVKELLKDWIKLYPNSFAPDVEFKIFQLADGDIIIQLHEDLSSMAVALLVLYFETIRLQDYKTTRLQDGLVAESIEAFITIDDTEVLLKQNEGKRAMVFCSQQDNKTTRQQVEFVETTTTKDQNPTAVRFILEDNYVLDYNFEKRPQPVKDCDMIFEEEEFVLPEEYESVKVGDVVKKKIDSILEEDGLTPKKMLMYILCGAIGLSIGFLIVYFMGR